VTYPRERAELDDVRSRTNLNGTRLQRRVHRRFRAVRLDERIETLLFPRGVRVWHFIVVPPLAMAVLLGLFRLVDRLILPVATSGAGGEAYQTTRTVLIGLSMASIIAVLAIRYRTGYELQIQKRNEQLEETRDFLTRIIEGTADAIIVRNADGRIASWNPAAEAIFGWTAEEMEGQPANRLVATAPDADEALRRIDAALREGRTIRNLETSGVRKDGSPITFSLTVAPLYDASEGFAGTTAIVRDITVLKQMERQLLERERLAAVGELAAMVAHEVRNPLAGIRGGCEILLEGYTKGDPRHEIGVEIIHQVDRLTRTVHDLLTFARPRAIDPVPTDIHALIERILQNLRDDPENTGVEVVRDFAEDVSIAHVDGRQMEQVLLNLVINAIQATQRKGRVTIATRAHHRQLVITVEDDGPGIPADKIGHIFQPFFTTRAQGTGLGLAIVKKIVEAHRGRIEAASIPGAGARFTMTLPREA
jgi:two-component system, NtrC family, sensor histidine kinase HydH